MTSQVPKYSLLAAKLQAAVVDHLRTVLQVPIYDYVPEGTAIPYVVISSVSVVPYRMKVVAAVDVDLVIDYWSLYAGFAETETVMDTIIQALTGQALVVQGANVVDVIWESCNLTVETTETEIHRHGQLIVKWRLTDS
jgi:hypothetical protein